MPLAQQVELLHSHIRGHNELLSHNNDLFSIYEGDLLRFVLRELKNQLSIETYEIVKQRASPINILTRFIDKLSKIYQQNPVRYVVDGAEKDEELLSFYSKSMDIDNNLNISNEFFNLFKNNLIQPYIYKGMPRLRSIPSNSFIVWSDNDVDPTIPTHVITFHSHFENGKSIPVYHAYTDDEFIIFDEEGRVRRDLMAMFDNEEGVNLMGKLPFVYVNKSNNLLIPKIDTDIMKMTLLLPVMLSDLNFAVMMQAFSILYGIDVDSTGIRMSPNAFWNLKSDATSDKKPELGILKPQVEIEAVLNLIKSEFDMWLQTKGIKPGAIGDVSVQNASSGISKMIDEMDTSEQRQKQAVVYQNAEAELWNLVMNHAHPLWRRQGIIDTSLDFTPGAMIKTNFAEQLPLLKRGDIVRDLKDEVAAGFISTRRAIKKLNPRMSDSEIDELITEINESGVSNGMAKSENTSS